MFNIPENLPEEEKAKLKEQLAKSKANADLYYQEHGTRLLYSVAPSNIIVEEVIAAEDSVTELLPEVTQDQIDSICLVSI